jgi:hypothetical protein
MGCCCSVDTSEDIQEFQLLVQAIAQKKFDVVEMILSGLKKNIREGGYNLYHILVTSSFVYTEQELQAMCKLFYKYKHYLNDSSQIANTEYAVQYVKLGNTFSISWLPNGAYEYDHKARRDIIIKDCFNINGLSALALAYKLLKLTDFNNNLTRVIKLLNGAYDIENKNEQQNITVAEKQGDNNKCVICMDLTEQIMLRPCKHVCVCEKCNIGLKNCPLCKKVIINTERVFIA